MDATSDDQPPLSQQRQRPATVRHRPAADIPSPVGLQRLTRAGTVRTTVRGSTAGEASLLKPAVFLDRDGTIMHDPGYCSRPDQVRLIDGAADALARLKSVGFLLVVVTNQSGIGRGLITIDQYESVEREVSRQVGEGVITQTYFCASRPGSGDPRRKPSPQMVFEAMRDHSIDPRRSWLIGDKAIDMQCGRRAGLQTILVQTGYGAGEVADDAHYVRSTIVEAVDLIVATTLPLAEGRP